MSSLFSAPQLPNHWIYSTLRVQVPAQSPSWATWGLLDTVQIPLPFLTFRPSTIWPPHKLPGPLGNVFSPTSLCPTCCLLLEPLLPLCPHPLKFLFSSTTSHLVLHGVTAYASSFPRKSHPSGVYSHHLHTLHPEPQGWVYLYLYASKVAPTQYAANKIYPQISPSYELPNPFFSCDLYFSNAISTHVFLMSETWGFSRTPPLSSTHLVNDPAFNSPRPRSLLHICASPVLTHHHILPRQ